MMESLAASKTRRQRKKLRMLAIGITTCVFAGLLWYQRGSGIRGDALDTVRSSAAVMIRPEKRTLPDGSIVELKPGAVITVDYQPDARRVSLERGEAFFQVAKAAVPFVVSARAVGVRAVGTAFSVQVGARVVEVLVTEGTVAVGDISGPTNSPAARKARLRRQDDAATEPAGERRANGAIDLEDRRALFVAAGSHALVDPQAEAPVVSTLPAAEIANRLAWRKKRLEFTDTPLSVAVDLFNRHSNRGASNHLLVDPTDAALGRLQVSGYFDAENVDAFVHLIEQTCGITAERQAGPIVLRRAR
jgi:transmembrane sensor